MKSVLKWGIWLYAAAACAYMKTNTTAYMPPGGYHKNDIVVASPPIVLDLSPGADLKPFFVTAGVSGLLGFVMLVSAGAAALRQRRQEM
jgi:hypothetical protein